MKKTEYMFLSDRKERKLLKKFDNLNNEEVEQFIELSHLLRMEILKYTFLIESSIMYNFERIFVDETTKHKKLRNLLLAEKKSEFRQNLLKLKNTKFFEIDKSRRKWTNNLWKSISRENYSKDKKLIDLLHRSTYGQKLLIIKDMDKIDQVLFGDLKKTGEKIDEEDAWEFFQHIKKLRNVCSHRNLILIKSHWKEKNNTTFDLMTELIIKWEVVFRESGLMSHLSEIIWPKYGNLLAKIENNEEFYDFFSSKYFEEINIHIDK